MKPIKRPKASKSPTYRHQDPSYSERAAEWDGAARSWIRDAAVQVFAGASQHADITAGDVVIALDRRPDLPTGYARYIEPAFYDRRYQMVRTELERMLRDGVLEAGTTVNARGREGVRCYRRAVRPLWRVEVEPANEHARAAIEGYLREHGSSLKSIDSILISRQYHPSDIFSRGLVTYDGPSAGAGDDQAERNGARAE